MQNVDSVDSAAVVVACLPAAEAERLLERLPMAEAAELRRRAASSVASGELYEAAARRFVRELSRGRTQAIRRRIDPPAGQPAWHMLACQQPARLVQALQDELPQTVAAILLKLPATQSAVVMAQLPERFQTDVLQRMLTARPVRDEVLSELAEVLVSGISQQDVTCDQEREAQARVAAVLRCVDAATRQRLIEAAQREGWRIGREPLCAK